MMNMNITTRSLVCPGVVSLLLLSCLPPDNPTPPSAQEQQKKVEKTVEILNASLVNKDREALDRICSEGLSYGHSTGIIQDKATFIDDVMNGPFRYINIQIENQKVELVEDLAIVTHIFVAQGLNKGDSVDVRLGAAHVYKLYRDGRCQLVLRQGYKLQ